MRLSIKHTTQYDYEAPVIFALQRIRLRPDTNKLQTVDAWELEIDGGQIETRYRDHYGNQVDLVSATPGTRSLTITARGAVDTHDLAGVLGHVYGRAPLWHFMQATQLTQAGNRVCELAQILTASGDDIAQCHALSRAILKAAPYEFGHTKAETSAEGALEIGRAVCQDHANIFVAAARKAGYPARYVSGYLMMNDRIDQDASHAWAEVHLDGLGWVGFDVSNGVCPDERYARLAIGRDARDAAPISGLRAGSGDESMIVSLQVQQ